MASDAEPGTTADAAETQLAHDDGEVAKEGSDKPTTQTLAKWDAARKGKLQEENPDVYMWLVDSKDEDIGSFGAVYVRGGADNPKFKGLCERLGMAPEETVKNSRGSFLKGQPLLEEETVTIPVLYGKHRPPFGFRTTHGGSPDGSVAPMPYRGMKPRGYGVVKTDPLRKQAFFQRHLNWRWRGRSPFLSVTTRIEVVQYFADMYRLQGCRDVKIHLINMHAEDWDRDEPPVFYAADVVRAFGILRERDSYETEYLVEGAIPEGSIIATAEGGKVPRHWEAFAEKPRSKAALTKLLRELRKLLVRAKKEQSRRQNKRQVAPVRKDKKMRVDLNSHRGEEDRTRAEKHEKDLERGSNDHEGGNQDTIEPTAGEEPEEMKEVEGEKEHEDRQMEQDGDDHEGTDKPEEGDKLEEGDKPEEGANPQDEEADRPEQGDKPEEGDTPQDQEANRPENGDTFEATGQPADEASGTTGTNEKTTTPEPKREVRRRCRGFHRVTSKQD
jgi:hypothetical protein